MVKHKEKTPPPRGGGGLQMKGLAWRHGLMFSDIPLLLKTQGRFKWKARLHSKPSLKHLNIIMFLNWRALMPKFHVGQGINMVPGHPKPQISPRVFRNRKLSINVEPGPRIRANWSLSWSPFLRAFPYTKCPCQTIFFCAALKRRVLNKKASHWTHQNLP